MSTVIYAPREEYKYEIYNTETEEVGWTQWMTESEAQEENDILRGKSSPSRWLKTND